MSVSSSSSATSSRNCCKSTSCSSSLSCYEKYEDKCIDSYQFLDFLETGPVFLRRPIPVPRCQEVVGCEKTKSKLGLKFQEARAPFFTELGRPNPYDVPCRATKTKCCKSKSSCSACSSHSSRTSSCCISKKSCTPSTPCDPC
jgi:hypothetical protein